MRALVTGAAGFIGSHLTDRLLDRGDEVVGIDSMTDYYPPSVKWDNLTHACMNPRFSFIQADLMELDLRPLVEDADVVFHQAGQPGTRLSWSHGFGVYVTRNLLTTQRLLEASKDSGLRRLVFASSSSLYGNSPTYPCTEETVPNPFSPYGVTKLAAEHLCTLYAQNYGVPAVSLRYFTVYGPRQRPDMGIHQFIASALRGDPVRVFGDGSQIRDFTYVDDIVEANLAAADADVVCPLSINIAGGSAVSVGRLLAMIGEALGSPLEVERLPEQAGDVRRTGGSTERAHAHLSWKPAATLEGGLREQVRWQRETAGR